MVELRVVAWSLAVGVCYALVLVGLGVAGGASALAGDGGIHWLAPLVLAAFAGWCLLRPGLVTPGLALGLVAGLAALSPSGLRATLEGQELFALLGGCNLFVALGGVEYAIRRVGGLYPLTLSRETERALAAGAVAGVAYLALVGVVASLATGRPMGTLVPIPESFDGLLIASYLYGGLWLTGAVPVALFVRFGTIVPLGVTALDVLLFVSNPSAGDFTGPLAVFAWPLYVLLFGVLGGIERVSYEYVRDKSRTLVTARRVVVGAIFSALVGVGLFAALPVWRVVPIRDPLPLRVENEDDEAHTVDVYCRL